MYALFFSYNSTTWQQMTVQSGDRAAAVRAVVEELGGTLVAMYFMLGPFDGIVIADLPDAAAAAALSTVATATGAYRHVETHPLIDPADLSAVLTRARTVGERFVRPGA